MSIIKIPFADLPAVRAGDPAALTVAVAACAARWFALAGSNVSFPHQPSDVAREEGTAKAGLLAAAMDLRALLTESPNGRQALADFGFQPLLEHVEGE